MNSHNPSNFTNLQTVALAFVSALSWIPFCVLPYEISVLVTKYHATTTMAGWLTSAELLVIAAAASWVGRTIATKDKRRITIIGVCIASIGNGLSLGAAGSLYALLIARLISAIGLGIIAAATNALPAYHHNPERMYGAMQLAVSIIFSTLMFAVPVYADMFEGLGIFGIELVLTVGLGLLSFCLPTGNAHHFNADSQTSRKFPMGVIPVLIAIMLVILAQSATWAFADQAGQGDGIPETTLSVLFTLTGLMTIPAALAATAIGTRFGLKIPLVVGFTLQIFVALALYCINIYFLFAPAVVILAAASVFTLPYLQGILVELDDSGHSAAYSGVAINFGAAAGPVVGVFSSSSNAFAPIGIAVTIVLIVALSLAFRGLRRAT